MQLVPIKITHGPNGMILTPMEGDLANQAADETALRPIPNAGKYRGLPIFGPSAEEQWTGISGNDEIISALLRTPLKENDISDFEKVFERTDDHIWKREDITYPTKHRPIFQTPHDSTFDFRPWSAAEERLIRKRYNCQECSVLVNKLTFSSHKPVNLNKVLQAQLYCGFDYISDDSSEDDISEVSPEDKMSGNNGQVLYNSALDCEEICIGKATNQLYIPVRGIKLNSDDEESITERLSSCSEDDDCTLDREGERTMNVKNGCVNSAVDPFVDHSYHLDDNEDNILGVDCSADELFNENLEIFDTDNENSGENNASKEEDENLMDEADICRSVLLDYMDVEPNGESIAEAMSGLNDSEETQINEECLGDPVEIHDTSAVDSNYKSDDEISATTYESEELSDWEMDELPAPRGYEPIDCDSPKDAVETSPIVITPIADEDCEEFPLEEMNSYQTLSPVQNHNFSFINDNVVGEVNIKTEGEDMSQESPEVSVSNNSVINVNETDDLTDAHLEDEDVLKVPKNPKVSKKKKRRSSSSDSVEGKEVFEIKLPEDFRHMPIFHNYSLLPDCIKFSKPSKRIKRSGNKRSTKISRIETTVEAEEPNATWLVNKSTKNIMLKVKNKPPLLFRVSSGNKLLNVDNGSKNNSSNLPTVSNTSNQVSISASKAAASGKLNSRVCPSEIPSSSPSSTPVKSLVKMTSLLTGSSVLTSPAPGSNVPVSRAPSSSVSVSKAPSSGFSVSREPSSSASVSRAPSSNVSVSRTTRSSSSVSGTLGSRPTGSSLLKSNVLKRKAVSPSVSAPIKKVFISKTSGSGVIASRPLTTISGTSLLTTSTTAIKSATPSLTASTMGANVVLSSVKKNFTQKHKEPKLLSLLKPLNLKPSTDVEPKKELTMAGSPVSKSTGRFQHRSATQTADSRPAIDIYNVKKEVNDPNLDDPKIRRKKEPTVTFKVVARNLTKRKHNDVEVSEPDLNKLTVQSKEDRIKKLKDRLKKQEEELEKIKKDREATKTLISLYESDS